MLSRLSLVARNGLRPALQSAALLRSSVVITQRLQSTEITTDTKDLFVRDIPKGEPATQIGGLYNDIKNELYKKTGETGQLFFAGGLFAYLMSKEIYVCNDETLLIMVIFPTLYWLYKKIGPGIAQYLDDYSNDILDRMNASKARKIHNGEAGIRDEQAFQDALVLCQDSVEVMKENNAMALEIEYRQRLHHVTHEIQRRLDYQVEIESTKARLEQEHMVDWIVDSVLTSITPQQQKDSIKQCIKDLNTMTL